VLEQFRGFSHFEFIEFVYDFERLDCDPLLRNVFTEGRHGAWSGSSDVGMVTPRCHLHDWSPAVFVVNRTDDSQVGKVTSTCQRVIREDGNVLVYFASPIVIELNLLLDCVAHAA